MPLMAIVTVSSKASSQYLSSNPDFSLCIKIYDGISGRIYPYLADLPANQREALMAKTHPSASNTYGLDKVPLRLKNDKGYFSGVMRPIYESEMENIRAETLEAHTLWTKAYVHY